MSTENTTGVDATQVIPASPSDTGAAGTAGQPRRMPWRPAAPKEATASAAAPTATQPTASQPRVEAPVGGTAAPASAAPAKQATGPRRVRLVASRVDPWSVMKLSFLLSIAMGIALVVAVAVLWNVLNAMQVFTQIDGIVTDIAGTESFINVLEYVEFSRVMSIAVVIAVVDIVIITALATLFTFLYNVVAALVGGLHVTLTDE